MLEIAIALVKGLVILKENRLYILLLVSYRQKHYFFFNYLIMRKQEVRITFANASKCQRQAPRIYKLL